MSVSRKVDGWLNPSEVGEMLPFILYGENTGMFRNADLQLLIYFNVHACSFGPFGCYQQSGQMSFAAILHCLCAQHLVYNYKNMRV